MEDYTLRAGDKLVSLALRRLARAPSCTYRDATQHAIVELTHRIDGAIRKLFTCRKLLAEDEYQAETTRFDLPAVGGSVDDALDKAVSGVASVLGSSDGKDPEHQKILAEVRALADAITIGRAEAEAIVNFLGVEDRATKDKALRFFTHASDRQTLGATLDRVTPDTMQALRKIMNVGPN